MILVLAVVNALTRLALIALLGGGLFWAVLWFMEDERRIAYLGIPVLFVWLVRMEYDDLKAARSAVATDDKPNDDAGGLPK